MLITRVAAAMNSVKHRLRDMGLYKVWLKQIRNYVIVMNGLSGEEATAGYTEPKCKVSLHSRPVQFAVATLSLAIPLRHCDERPAG